MSELRHFGVRGMKWGVRKKREPHPESSRRFDKRKAWELSDAELNKRINRINKERQYSDMTASKVSKFRKAGVKAVGAMAAGITIVALRKRIEPGIGKAMDKGFDYVSTTIGSLSRSGYVANIKG